MFVTLETSHVEISLLKFELLKAYDMSVTLEVSHVEISLLKFELLNIQPCH